MRIAMIGTRGVPARYGGFETAVEEVGQRLVQRGHEVVVYCRNRDAEESPYLGMHLVHVPAVRHRIAETLSHTALSMLHAWRQRPDVALVFNAANACLLPLLRSGRIPVAVHVDGLEWQRAKWGPGAKRFYRMSERLAVRWGDALIADAQGISQYYSTTYHAATVFLPYGAPILARSEPRLLDKVSLAPRQYHLAVARFEPENHIDMIVDGYNRSGCTSPLVVVGSAPYSAQHSAAIQQLASRNSQVRLLGAVWDQALLNELYAFARTYVHGHSVGGTNPSLLRAMGAGAPVLAFDVIFNREVAGDTAYYFDDASSLATALRSAEGDPDATVRRGLDGQSRAQRLYDWEAVAKGYETLCASLTEAASS